MPSKKKTQGILRNTITASEAKIEAFTTRLELFLRREISRIISRMEAEELDALGAAAVLGDLYSVLLDAGLDEQLTEITEIYGEKLERMQDDLENLGLRKATFAAADVDVAEALIRFDAERMAKNVELYVDDIRSILLRTVITGELPTFDAINDRGDGETRQGNLAAKIKTELNTSIQSFSRSITIGKFIDAGFELFVYIGPDDKVTREFCQERVDQVWTLAQVNSWDNGQGIPAISSLGGYNCRHSLVGISPEEARAEYGWKG